MARALAANGAKRVYLLGRRLDVLNTAAREHPGVFVPTQCDVTSHASLQSAVDRVASDTGYINLLVANSGASGHTQGMDSSLPLSELRSRLFTEEVMGTMTSTLQVNVTGAFSTILAFLELLDAGNKRALEGGFGGPAVGGSNVPTISSQVVVTASIAALSRMSMSAPAYVASKAGILQLAKYASANLAAYGIRVNALAPGLFPSVLASQMIGNRDPSTEDVNDPRFIPARRFGGDVEMAGQLLYLASRAGAYTNGGVMLVDGGRSSVMRSSY
ncbi:hypothetical protein VTH82DRAFT_6795 [Thermothelomyces myriococcoides]